ncbi:restriction endonuclease [Nannocystis pusilla]|uniref:restriction endonuclease n=1 Tax=Nannocystis pusilla TaxID=889268 RepID=UPI003DA6859B
MNERTLPQLVADYLSLQGHETVVVTDGPGDGGRDIHSQNSGSNFLTQCKYHAALKKTVSSKEISELPMAMVKLGIKQGLFVTNSKISPQAKREFIDNYPGLTLSFIDGLTLARIVLDSAILRALWVSGTSASEVNRAVSFVVIARDMLLDRPIRLRESSEYATEIRQLIENANLELQISAGTACSLESMPKYAPPARRTISEFGNHISGLGIVVRGPSVLQSLDRIIDQVQRAIAASLGQNTHVAVRTARPSLIPLGGPHAGAVISFDTAMPSTLRCGPGSAVESEHEYLWPGDRWHAPQRLSGSIAHAVGWFNPKLNAILDINLPHRMDADTRSREDLFDEDRIRWCIDSLFILAPPERVQLNEHQGGPPLPPSLNISWPDGRIIAAWLHPYLVSNFVSLSIEPDVEEADEDPFALHIETFKEAIRNISNWCSATPDIELVPSEKARHMLAAVGFHLLPSTPFMAFRSIDLLRGALPSPFSTQQRELFFSICWWLPPQARTINEALTFLRTNYSSEDVTYQIDSNPNRKPGSYIICKVQGPTGRPECSTREMLDSWEPNLTAHTERIESLFREGGFVATRDSERYWSEELFVDFSLA